MVNLLSRLKFYVKGKYQVVIHKKWIIEGLWYLDKLNFMDEIFYKLSEVILETDIKQNIVSQQLIFHLKEEKTLIYFF